MPINLLVLLFGAALFVGAALVFSIQPMISKMVLPLLGGAPAVWNTIVVFFQGALFAGYVYAWLLDRYLAPARQALVHLLLLACALALLPVAVTVAWGEPDPAAPQFWLLRNLTLFVAIPFIIVSGTSTLLQAWFARSGRPGASDPYFLYVASNAGSLLALVSYPVLVEPRLTLAAQARGWTLAYGGLVVLTALAAASIWYMRRSAAADLPGPPASGSATAATAAPATTETTAAATVLASEAPGWARRLHWMGLAFVPSMLLLGTTLHLSTDVAAVPFLWIAPLLIYLLTFILAFARRNPIPPGITLTLQALALVALAAFFRISGSSFWLALSLNLGALFFSGLVCHATLARDRPAPRYLAEFYLWLAFGGWLGGLVAGIVAPLIFNGIYEYPIALGLACIARAGTRGELMARPRRWWPVIALAVACLVVTLTKASPYAGLMNMGVVILPAGIVLAVLLFLNRGQLLVLACGIALLVADAQFEAVAGKTLLQERTFFGVYRVREEEDGNLRTLYHGTTLHGGQAQAPGAEKITLMYYFPRGPVGQLISARRAAGAIGDVGIIGLGAGSLPCLLEDAHSITYFEIDPAVARIAGDPALFSFLARCGQHTHVEIGDGRLLLARKPDGIYDLLVIDAFSSDAIPVHLLTAEAMAMYVRKLRPGGVVAFHITNRYMNLAPVIAQLADNAQLQGLIERYKPTDADRLSGAENSDWIALARSRTDLAFIQTDWRWQSLPSATTTSLWTDEFSDVFSVLLRGGERDPAGARIQEPP